MERSSTAHAATLVAATPHDSSPAPSDRGLLLVLAVRAGTQHVLVVSGEADVFNANQLRDDIVGRFSVQPASLIVDLTALTFCDLHGLDALQAAARAAAEAGIDLAFRGASPRLSWMDRRFPASRGGGPRVS